MPEINDLIEKTVQETVEKQTKKSKKKNIFLNILLGLIVVFLVIEVILSLPFKNKNISCNYSLFSDKLTCTQIGDVVPEWFEDMSIFNNNYSMKLIAKNNEEDYIALNMTKAIIVPGLKRKFIYEEEDSNVFEYYKLRQMMAKNEPSNWGTIALYCSENTLQNEICANMKKRNSKN